MKITDMIWFTEFGSTRPIGIVLGKDVITGETKAYIGNSQGFSEEDDAKHIAEFGAKLSDFQAKIIAKWLAGEKSE